MKQRRCNVAKYTLYAKKVYYYRKDIKSEWYEGNDSHSTAEYRGACESLDMLVTHFQKLDDFTKWKKEKKNESN